MKSITIVGGGLAGLSLGIALRRCAVPVTILEAGSYPRHRVCGEFICGRGQQVLGRFGLTEKLYRAGACAARTVSFFLGQARSQIHNLRPSALCLSRFTMDALLAKQFREQGGDLREHTRWHGNESPEGLVLAAGRRLRPVEDGWRWLGLKIHARDLELESDLEIHSLPTGYVGLCRLGVNQVNICGLFRKRQDEHFSKDSWQSLIRGPNATALHARLQHASFEEHSFCSVAGFSIKPHRSSKASSFQIGDALTMIPPVTGNGMSMAFEAAELAAPPLAAFSRGDVSWDQARVNFSRACDAAFARRLLWARLLHCLMLVPVFRHNLGNLALHSPWLWRFLFAMTR